MTDDGGDGLGEVRMAIDGAEEILEVSGVRRKRQATSVHEDTRLTPTARSVL